MKPVSYAAFVAVFVGLCAANVYGAAKLTGAGATFPYPLYAKWAEVYRSETGVAVNYQSIGSGGGIKQIKAKTVHFGASDKPLKPKELDEAGLVQFPMVMGGVVPAINLPEIKNRPIRLSGPVLADIFLGKIKKWNDPRLTALNPGLPLPNRAVIVVHRSDGSGTTFIFTNYLSKVSPEWKAKVGESSAIEWPVGIGGKGNEGVASFVQKIKGSIGYIEYSFAEQIHMPTAQLKNREGHYVSAKADTFTSAASSVDWSSIPGFNAILTDQPGAQSWPITGATFILMHKTQDDAVAARDVLKFFDWAYTNGGEMAQRLHYIPMPGAVAQTVKRAWQTQIKDRNGRPIW